MSTEAAGNQSLEARAQLIESAAADVRAKERSAVTRKVVKGIVFGVGSAVIAGAIGLAGMAAVTWLTSESYFMDPKKSRLPDDVSKVAIMLDNPVGCQSPADIGVPSFELLSIPSLNDQSIVLKGWFCPQNNSSTCPTIVYFHNGTGNIGQHLAGPAKLYESCGANLVMVDFQGFGASGGKASRCNALADAKAVINHVLGALKNRIDDKKVFVYGFGTTGSSVALDMAVDEKLKCAVTGVIVDGVYDDWRSHMLTHEQNTLMKLGCSIFGDHVFGDPYKNLIKSQNLDVPILFINNSRDPNSKASRAFDQAKSLCKGYVVCQGSVPLGKCATECPGVVKEMVEFIRNPASREHPKVIY